MSWGGKWKKTSNSLDFLNLIAGLIGTYRSEETLQRICKLTAWHRWFHGFPSIVHLLKEKLFLAVLLDWGFQKYSVIDSASHWLWIHCSEAKKAKSCRVFLNPQTTQTLLSNFKTFIAKKAVPGNFSQLLMRFLPSRCRIWRETGFKLPLVRSHF